MADEFDLKPTSRGEEFLDVILRSLGGDTPDIPQPAWRYEEYLAAIANAIQNGGGGGSSGGGVLVVHEDENGTLDKTYAEIKSASNDSVVLLHSGDDILYLTAVWRNLITGAYSVAFFGNNALNQYEADAEDGYPVIVS